MAGQIEPIARMAQQLSRLPGIGAKQAQRLAYHIVSSRRIRCTSWPAPSGRAARGKILLDLRQLHGGRPL